MVSRVAAWVCALSALSLVGGCGKAEGGAAPIQQNELPSRLASLLCDSLNGCCQHEGFAFDLAACKSGYAAEFRESLDEYTPDRVAYDAQAAGDCLAAFGAAIQCGQPQNDEPAACERVFRGKVAQGQACNQSQECAPVSGQRVSCSSPDGVSPEVCTAYETASGRRGKAGEACSFTCDDEDGGDCGSISVPAPGPGEPQPAQLAVCYRSDGLFCDVAGCAPLLAVGEECTDYDSCSGKAFCDFRDINVSVCTAPRANGEACDSNNQCQSERCGEQQPSVDPSAPLGQCVAKASVSAEQCSNDFTDDTTEAGDPGSGAPQPGMP